MSTLWLGGSGATQEVQNLEQRRDRIIHARACPQCGSSKYKHQRATKKLRELVRDQAAEGAAPAASLPIPIASELEKLEELRLAGTLSNKDYKAAKKKLLEP